MRDITLYLDVSHFNYKFYNYVNSLEPIIYTKDTSRSPQSPIVHAKESLVTL